VKVGVVGCGRIATSVHMPSLKKIEGYDLVAASDPDHARLQEAKDRFDLDEIYYDYRRMLAEADIDAVFVCTPPETHFRIVMDSLERGKHVFCEKPLASSVEDGLTVKKTYEMQRKTVLENLFLMPAHNYVFTPCFVEALKLIERGEIGKIRRIDACVATNLQFYRAKTDFRSQAKCGVLEDLLPHLIYLVHRVAGPFQRIAWIEPHLKDGIISNVNVEASLANDVSAALAARWTGLVPTLQFDLEGESGKIRMDLMRTPYNANMVKGGEVRTIALGRRFRQYFDVLRQKHPSYFNEHHHFLECAEGKAQPQVSVDDGIELIGALNEVTECFQGKSSTPLTEAANVVVLRAEDNIEATVQESIDMLGGLSIKKDDLVVVKPNVCFPSNPENMVIVDPRVLEAVLRIVKRKTRNVLVVESDALAGTAEERLASTGVFDIIRKCEAEFLNLSKDDVEEHKVAGLQIEIPKTVLRADYFINLPKVKTCTRTVVSIAMKNMFGVLATGKKSRLHSHLTDVLVHLNQAIRQDLIIADGIVAMEGLGPIHGKRVDLGLIISGRNPVTVDAACCHIVGFNAYAIEALWKAHQQGLGEIDPQKIRFMGEDVSNVKSRFSRPTFSKENIVEALKTEFRIKFRGG